MPTEPSVLLTLTGPAYDELLPAVLTALAGCQEDVLELDQVTVGGVATLALATTSRSGSDEVCDAVGAVADRFGWQFMVRDGRNASPSRAGRASVVVLGTTLPAGSVAALTDAIVTHGARIGRVRRLAGDPVTALDLDVFGADVPLLRRELAGFGAAYGVDVAVADGGLARRGRRLLVMDVDSTLIQDEVIELLARYAGQEGEVAEVTQRAMRGELDFEQSLHARVATLAGLPESVLDDVRAAVRLTPGARTLVATVKRLGFTVAVVSGGFLEIVGPLAGELGIHHAHANRLEIVDGRLTGRVEGPVVDRAEKARALRRFADQAGLPLSRTVAVGDGANDLDMLAIAGMGIAFNATPLVREQAHASVSVPYLDAVLYLLGIAREEIDEAQSIDSRDD